MTSIVRKGAVFLATLAIVPLGTAADVEAQQEEVVISSGGQGPDLAVPTRPSLFQLQAFGDEGAAGVRTNGSNAWCVQNIQGFSSRFNFGCATGWYTREADGGYTATIFDLGMKWAAPASDMDTTVIDPVDSGVKGGGYTVNMTTLILGGVVKGGGDKLWASDRSPIDLLAIGVSTSDKADCQNHEARRDGFMFVGFQLTPTSDCPATHPPSGWRGSRPIPTESFIELQSTMPEFGATYDAADPNGNDPFAFWRVPEELQRTDKFLGDWQTYGELNDWYLQALGRYGSVIPGGASAPSYDGWPLGLTQFYDVFYFGLPTVGNVMYYMSTIVNESEKVYGVGITYDSVYIGVNIDPLLQGQGDAHYYDPVRSAMLFKETGSRCAGAPIPPGAGCNTAGTDDWANGAAGAGMVFLKTPIGDARYKLFSDPTSEFFDPSHPRAGDTIMFQHQRQCGFGGCIGRTWSRSMRAHFGHFASMGVNTLDGETPGDLVDRTYHRIFRAEGWPERTGEYNKYVPGVDDGTPMWDWNHDGQPDTIYADACGSKGCVDLWSDTLPGGYANSYGNISDLSVGPVHMEPYDTVPFVVALVGAADSASMEAAVDNSIAFYSQFFLGPETAPPPRITAVDVVPGQDAEGQTAPGSSITLFFDGTSEEWEDPFLQKLDVSADIALNPWLQDSVDVRIGDNVAAIHIFKSCDGGTTFTQDGDCDGDPVSDATSKWSGFGWQPYQTFEAGPGGTLPNVFEDLTVQPGVTYTYSIITETRGATFNLVRGSAGAFTAEEVTFAPSLLGAVSASGTNPNVAVAYAPLNLAAGARAAELMEFSRSGASSVPVDFRLIGSAPESGQYRVLFADKLVVTQVENLDDKGATTSIQTMLEAQQVRSVTGETGDTEEVVIASVDFSRSGDVTMSGLAETSVEETLTQRTTVFEGGFGMVVGSGSEPLLASTTLTGEDATPGTFLGREDFPFFTVSVNADDGGEFDAETFTTATADTIAARVSPSVVWRTGANLSEYLAGDEYGEYALVWNGDSWGPSAPFNITDPGFEANALSSLASRPTGSTSSTSGEALVAVQEIDPDITELEAYSMPFVVRNNTYSRAVDVVVTSHQETVLVGQANDSIRVEVPAGLWVPGDVLHFVETVTNEVLDENGNTVLDAGGQPQTEQVTTVTFRAVLGCLAPRNSCDPTIGGDLQSGYIPVEEGTTETVEYFVPLKGGDEVVVDVARSVSAAEARATGTASLDDVHVVPNPYLFASAFERNTADRILKFTNLPPEGRIRIFDVAGRFIQEINYGPDNLQGVSSFCGASDCGGDLDWDMQTRERLELAAGLYVFVVEADGEKKMGKFVVIR